MLLLNSKRSFQFKAWHCTVLCKFIKNSSSYQGTYCNFISTPSTNSAANLAPAEGETSIMNSSTEKITQIFFLANKILPPLLARMFFPPQDIIFFFSSFFFVCEPNAYFKIKWAELGTRQLLALRQWQRDNVIEQKYRKF